VTRGVLAVAAAASLLYAPVAAGLARQWYQDPASSHGIILFAAAAFMVRRRLPLLRATAPAPANAGFALLLASLTLYAVGSLAGELFVLRISAVASLAAIVLTLCGTTHLRLLTSPFVLLLLAIPLPALVVTTLTLPMQLVASQMAATLLNSAGIATIRDGNILALSNVTLEVAEACSGLRSIVSLISIVAVCKAVGAIRTRGALALALATIPVAIAGNGMRVAATGVLAHLFGAGAARGLVHDLTGYVAFAGMCAVLVGLNAALNRRDHGTGNPEDACESPALAW
jgi:exosortase